MNKNFFVAVIALFCIVGCQKNQHIEENFTNEIGFSGFIGKSVTKAGVVDENIVGTQGFGVYAAYTEEKDFEGDVYSYDVSEINFMNNQKVIKEGTVWTYSPKKYWPNDKTHKISFFAYAPYVPEAGQVVANPNISAYGGIPRASFTVAEDVKDQIDFLIAPAVYNQTKPATGTPVSFSFKHVLSRIGFKVKTNIDDENTTVSITKIEIGKAGTTNNCFYPQAPINLDATNINWVPIERSARLAFTLTDEDNFIDSVASAVPNDDYAQLNGDNDYLMIIPQSLTALTLKVYYTVSTEDPNFAEPVEVNNEIVVPVPDNKANFEAGKAYSFNLNLKLDTIDFSATVDAWDETPAPIEKDVE